MARSYLTSLLKGEFSLENPAPSCIVNAAKALDTNKMRYIVENHDTAFGGKLKGKLSKDQILQVISLATCIDGVSAQLDTVKKTLGLDSLSLEYHVTSKSHTLRLVASRDGYTIRRSINTTASIDWRKSGDAIEGQLAKAMAKGKKSAPRRATAKDALAEKDTEIANLKTDLERLQAALKAAGITL